MSYYLDADKISLNELRKRIEETDLIPSRKPLLENLREYFEKLRKCDLFTLADLRKELKSPKNISAFSKKTGIDTKYLILLRREIEGYFPKAFPLSSFAWILKKEITKLESNGLKNSALLYEVSRTSKQRLEISRNIGIDIQVIEALSSLVDLTRIQWTSPITARMLVSSGYENAKKVSKANADALCNALDSVNNKNGFFKGKIGLRDVSRLIAAASYVS